MKAQIDPPRAMHHIRIMNLALSEIMRLTKLSRPPGAVALVLGETQGFARWLKPGDLSDRPLAMMAMRTTGMGCICVIVCDGDGARTGYLLSTLVNWSEYQTGFAVLEECYIPPDVRPGTAIPMAANEPIPDDVFDVM